ncbi:MAG TPA: hypothetical protein VLJ40_11195 [Arthrobacter sp.]|nr:hypothetical protein [Arthrobacter sp.]
MSNRPQPARRAAVPALSAEEFALQADTLAAVPHPATRPKKDKAYTFRMTEATLDRLRAAAGREDRSIQWIFDRVLLPALDDHEKK